MTRSIFSEGKEYISASRAAKKTGYASDYIGQLCRAKKIPGQLIGRTWYVDSASLLEYQKNRQIGGVKKLVIKKFIESKDQTLGNQEDLTLENLADGLKSVRLANEHDKNSLISSPIILPRFLNKPFFTYKNDDRPRLPELSKKGRYVEPIWTSTLTKQAIALTLSLLVAISAGFLTLENTNPQVASEIRQSLENISEVPKDLLATLPTFVKHRAFNTIGHSQVAAVSFFNAFSNLLEGVRSGFRSLKQIALDKFFFSSPPPQLTYTTTVTPSSPPPSRALTTPAPSINIGSLKSELKTELESYIRIQIDSILPSLGGAGSPVVIYTSAPALATADFESFRTNQVVPEIHYHITNQSNSDVEHNSINLGNITDGGTFTNASISDSTFSGSLVSASALSFTNATGTSATTTSLFSSNGSFDTICFSADTCRTTWPTGGSGTFSWTPTTYGVSTSTTLGFLNGFLSTASSTINSNLLITGNSTSTHSTSTSFYSSSLTAGNATTTNLFSTTASSTNLYSTNLFGNTANLSESGNLFYTDARANSYIHASTTIPKTYTANTFTGAQIFNDITRSTTTSATTTNFFSTTASSTNLYSSLFTLAGNTLTLSSNTTIGGTNTGDVTLAGTPDYITISGQTITRNKLDISDDTNATGGLGLTLTANDFACDTANTSTFGCLSSTDWNTFNTKLGSYDAWTHPTAGVSATTSSMIFTNASSTFTGNLNITGNSTTTNATTTNSFATTASSTNLFSSLLTVGGTGLVVDSNRNVGIGTTSPDSQAILHVNGGTSNALRITGSTQGRLLIEDSGATANQRIWEWMSDDGNLQASRINDAQSVRTTYLTINNSGNVGIGTTSPYAKLSVVGGTTGTAIGVDMLTGYSGNIMELKVASTTKFVINQNGDFIASGNSTTTNATSTNFFSTTASSTNLFGTTGNLSALTINSSASIPALSNLTGNGFVKTSGSNGTLSIDTTSYLSSYDAFTHPAYGGSATTSLLTLSGGFLNTAASSTIAGNLLITGNSTTTNATTTNLFSTTASTTNLWLATGACDTLDTDSTGKVICGTDATGAGGGSDPFTHPIVGVSATTSSMIFTNASSTFTGNLNISGNSTTTNATTTNLFSTTASSTNLFSSLLTVGGTGLIVDSSRSVGIGSTSPWGLLSLNPNGISGPSFVIGSSTQTNFIVTNGGNIGIGTTSPFARFSLVGNSVLDSNLITFASTTALTLTLDYRTTATSTIPNNKFYAWTIATSTTATPIFRIDTTSSGAGTVSATTSIKGGFTLDDGAFNYDSFAGITSVDSLSTGPMAFDTDAGILSWIDLPSSTTTAGIVNSYSALLGGNPILTIYGTTTSAGGINYGSVGIGTTSPYAKLSVEHLSTTGTVIGTDALTGFTGSLINLKVASTTKFVINQNGDFIASGNSTTTNATTTNFSTANASTTNLFVSSAGGSTGCAQFSITGLLSNTGSACGTGGGTFAWTPTAYGVSTSTTLGFLNGFLSTASSTINSNLTITGNSTTTNATTTNLFSTTASSTNLFTASFNGANLATCDSTTGKITWASGLFGCGTDFNTGSSSFGKTLELSVAGDFLSATSSALKSFVVGATTTAALNRNSLFQVNATGTTGNLISASSTTGFNGKFLSLNNAAGTELLRIDSTGALQTTASTTLQNFTALNSTSTNATTTSLAITNLTAADCDVKAATNGSIYCGTDATGGGGGASDTHWATSTGAYLGVTPNGGTNVNLGLGTSTPVWALTVSSSTGAQLALTDASKTSSIWTQRNAGGNLYFATSSPLTFATTSTSAFTIIGSSGNVGIGTTTPWGFLSVNPDRVSGPSFVIGSSTKTDFIVTNGGNVGIGTTSPYAVLSVLGEVVATNFTATSTTATSTFSGGLVSTGLSTFTNAEFGALTFDTNAGVVSWTDLPITSAAAAGTVERYTANLAGRPAISIYGTANGSGDLATGPNVGIGGTTSPYALLSVATTTSSLMDLFVIASSTTSGIVFKVDSYGRTFGDGAYSSPAADYAEYFYTKSMALKSGEVVCVDILENNAVKRCERGADNNVMGIVSTKPAVIGNYIKASESDPSHYAIIGMLGQVEAFVSTENGPINIGDSLTSASSTPGYAMRAAGGDSTVGIALEPFSGTGRSGSEESSGSMSTSTPFDFTQDRSLSTSKIKVLISRRNKSLVVEEVEALVVERVAGMKIEDKVSQMIKQSVDNLNLDPKIAAIAQDEAGKLNQNFASTTLSLSFRLDDIESIFAPASTSSEQTATSTASTSSPQANSFAGNFFKNLFARFTGWFASAVNGIGDFFANRVRTKELCVADDSGETCITKKELDALIAGTAAAKSQTDTSVSASATSTEPTSEPASAPTTSTTSTTSTSTPEVITEPEPELESITTPVSSESPVEELAPNEN